MKNKEKKIVSTGASSFVGYRIKYRHKNFSDECDCDTGWKDIPVEEGSHGVPLDGYLAPLYRHSFLYDYSAAHALAWWFLSTKEGRKFGTEVRIIPYDVEYTHTVKESEKHQVITLENKP